MRSITKQYAILGVTLAVFLWTAAPAAAEQVCGDVDATGDVTTADALAVLREAVRLPTNLICEDGDCSEVENRVLELEELAAELAARLDTVEQLTASLSVDEDTLLVSGVNLQIVSGSGATDGAVNGTGNLIVGYDEEIGTDDKLGSHNLVVGSGHSYRSYSGLLGGEDNAALAPGASVIGGRSNIASGEGASICGGTLNIANREVAAVLGGRLNLANDEESTIVGGVNNETQGLRSSILGGERNLTRGRGASISGGRDGLAVGDNSSISGGRLNSTAGVESTVGGGFNRLAPSVNSWQAGVLFQAN